MKSLLESYRLPVSGVRKVLLERRTAAGARTRATHPIREQRHRHGERGLLDPDTPLPYTTPKSRRQGPPQRVEREDTGGPV